MRRDAQDACPGFDDNLLGTTCDDGDANTTGDTYTDCNVCTGIPIPTCTALAGEQTAFITSPICAFDGALSFIDLSSSTPTGFSNYTIVTDASLDVVDLGQGLLDLSALDPGTYTMHLLIYDPADPQTPADFNALIGSNASVVLDLIAAGWCADLATDPSLLFTLVLDDCSGTPGCTDPCAPNYDAAATSDDGSCQSYDMTCILTVRRVISQNGMLLHVAVLYLLLR